MKLCSTSDPGVSVSFADAVRRGIAEDGGLFMPVHLPEMPRGFFTSIRSMSFPEIAFEVARCMLQGEIPDGDLRTIVQESINFPAPLEMLDNTTAVLELFHGPTLAFKDFGARFMARTVAYLHRNDARRLTILVATSGDTGSAVAHGFYNVDGIAVMLLYPSGRVSPIQEMQLTTLGGNVTALEIDGTFDDCQRLVKEAFADGELRGRANLTSANSINVARLLPQSFYYFNAYACIPDPADPVVFVVPSGNLGNLTAGLIAWKMGLPARRFVAAANANKVLPHFLDTGVFAPAETVATISNAMDVGNPSNLARVRALYGDDVAALRQALFSAWFSDDDTRRAIREVFQKHGYTMDPHGAVGYLALQQYRRHDTSRHLGILLETAHPSKFLDVYDEDMRKNIVIPDRLQEMVRGEKRSVVLSHRFEQFKEYLLAHSAG